MQTLTNVRVMTPTTVMRMHSALTQRGVSAVPATLVTLEMESLVQVHKIILKSHLCTLSIYGHCIHYHNSFNLQISMSVNWSYIYAIPMPTVLIQLVALSAHVAKALKEMDSLVQVNNL